jgi:hypothetical protein
MSVKQSGGQIGGRLVKRSALCVVVNKALGQYFSLLALKKASAQSCYAE